MTEQNLISEQPWPSELHTYSPPSSNLQVQIFQPHSMTLTSAPRTQEDSTRECPTLHGKQQNLISEQPLSLHPYPSSSSSLPTSHAATLTSALRKTLQENSPHSMASNKGEGYGMSRIKPNVEWRVGISQWLVCTPVIIVLSSLNLLSPSYWWYHRYRNVLECRKRASIELTFILLTFTASSPYRCAVLQVHFSLIVSSAYSFTLWWLLCKLYFLWLIGYTYNSFWLMHSCEMSSMYPVSGAF